MYLFIVTIFLYFIAFLQSVLSILESRLFSSASEATFEIKVGIHCNLLIEMNRYYLEYYYFFIIL